jgi:ATP-dependent DNA helicase RecQ
MDHLYIDYASYGGLKDRQIQRGETMISYVKRETCRNIQLLNYFGEEGATECGKCDVCIRKRREEKESRELEEELKLLIKSGKNDTESILEELPIIDEEEIVEILRTLVDEGLVSRNKNNKWIWL